MEGERGVGVQLCMKLIFFLSRFSFCDTPFILSTQIKGDLLKVECLIHMKHELQVYPSNLIFDFLGCLFSCLVYWGQ